MFMESYFTEDKIVNLTKEKIRFFLEELKGGNINDIRYRKTLINLFVNRIYLYDDKVVLIMNVGTKKVTVNTALLEDIDTNLNLTNGLDMKTEGERKKAQMAEPSGFSFAFPLLDIEPTTIGYPGARRSA